MQKLDVLKTRCEDLELLTKESVPLDTNGLVLRPSCTSTLAARKAKLNHLKNNKWRAAKRYSSLEEVQTKRGRKRQDWRFRNRVGIKAERQRKVYNRLTVAQYVKLLYAYRNGRRIMR